MKVKAKVKRPLGVLEVPTGDLLIDQEHKLFRNIRGTIGVTTDLQKSLPKDGQIKRIQVIPHPEEKGKYIVLDGHRRTMAARKAGIPTMKIEVVDVPLHEVTKFMLLSTMRKEIPVIALDRDGNVVGGYCHAVHDLIEKQGMKRVEVARLTGLKPDTISALKDLYHEEIVEIRRAVAAGRMAITVYWRLRRLPDEVKREMLSLKGEITRKKIESRIQQLNTEAAAEMAAAEKAEQTEEGLDELMGQEPEVVEAQEQPADPIQSKFEFVEERFGGGQTQASMLMEALSLMKRAQKMSWESGSGYALDEIRNLAEKEW